jgi:hypothetical protein
MDAADFQSMISYLLYILALNRLEVVINRRNAEQS